MMSKLLILFAFIWVLPVTGSAIDWPSEPRDSAQPIGNSWGEYQNYGGWSYLHPGIDIMGYPGQPVYAVAPGIVKAVLTTYEELHWRVAVGETAGPEECDGWLYAHLDRFTIAVSEGEWISEGQYLGDLVYWPTAEFHHLHFAKIRGSGNTWDADWEFIQNPMVELSNIDDFDPPQFVTMPRGERLAFCFDETADYFTKFDSLYGALDIVARTYDLIGHPTWRCTPHKLGYLIKSDTMSTDTLLSFIFEGQLFWTDNIKVMYKEDSVLLSHGSYEERDFFFILTNTDGDSVVEASDVDGCWRTYDYANDDYWVVGMAADAYGNVSYDSMFVHTSNFFEFTGIVSTSDMNPDPYGSVVSISAIGLIDSCDQEGSYILRDVPAGSYYVNFSRNGYESVDTLVRFNTGISLDVVLNPASYVWGDVNGSGEVDIDDIVYLVTYIFVGGPAPEPYVAGDADGSGEIDIDDVVYLIEYIFG